MMSWISVGHSKPYNYMTHGSKFWRKEKKLKTLVFGVHSWINSVILQSVQKCLFMTTSWDSLKDIKPINQMKLHRNRENSIFNWLDFLKSGGDLRIWRCSYLLWGVWFIIPVMRSVFFPLCWECSHQSPKMNTNVNLLVYCLLFLGRQTWGISAAFNKCLITIMVLFCDTACFWVHDCSVIQVSFQVYRMTECQD